MDKQPVGQLPDLTQSNNDDEIMVITDSEHNQLKKEKISDFITDLTSTDENNAIVKGTDGKLFTKDFGNASNITEGILPTSVLPEIPLEKLPVSGVTADTYAYPSSVTVNAQGQVTAIEEGTPSGSNANTDLSNITEAGKEVIRETAGSDYHLTQNQITNCILSAPNGVATYSGNTITVKQGLKVLIPNGRNADGTLNNIEYVLNADVEGITSVTYDDERYFFLSSKGEMPSVGKKDFYVSSSQPTAPNTNTCLWFNPETNLYKLRTVGTSDFVTQYRSLIGEYNWNGSQVTSLIPYQPVELLKRSDKVEITSWGMPDYSAGISISALPFVPPSNGVVIIEGKNIPAGESLLVRSNNYGISKIRNVHTGTTSFLYSPPAYVSKNESITVDNYFKVGTFYPLKGAQND